MRSGWGPDATWIEFEGRNQCVFVPSSPRINTRPDGLEVVLIERQTDPFFEVYREADGDPDSDDLCVRPEGSAAPPARRTYAPVSFP